MPSNNQAQERKDKMNRILGSYRSYLNKRYIPAAERMLSVWFERVNGQALGPPTKEETEDKLRDVTDKRQDVLEATFDVPGGVVHVRVGRSETRSSGRVIHYSERTNGIYFVREMLNDDQIERVMRQDLYPPAHMTVPILDGTIENMHCTRYWIINSRIRGDRSRLVDSDLFRITDDLRTHSHSLESDVLSRTDSESQLYGETLESLAGFLDDVDEHMREVSRSVGSRGGGDDDEASISDANIDVDRLATIIHAYCDNPSGHIHVFLGATEFLAVVSPVSGSRSLYLTSREYLEAHKYTEELYPVSDDAGNEILQAYKDVYDSTQRNVRRRIDPEALAGIRSYVLGEARPPPSRRFGGSMRCRLGIAAGIAVAVVASLLT